MPNALPVRRWQTRQLQIETEKRVARHLKTKLAAVTGGFA
jgi:hypothetical protein